MTNGDNNLDGLRKKAERAVRHQEQSPKNYTEEDVREMVHELQVYQTELEMQNDSLQKSKAKLDRLMKKYRDLFNLAPMGYVITDENLVIKEANLTFSKILGLEVESILRKKLTSFVTAESQDDLYLHFRRVSETMRKHSSEITLNGSTRIDVTIVSVIEKEGEGTSIRSVLLDTTDLMNLQRSNAELQQFAYIASHDLREPLRMITSYLGLLEKRYDGKVLDPKAKEYLHFAADGAARMQNMINDLLAYSRLETQELSLEHFRMDDVLATALNDLKAIIDESGTSITHDRLPSVKADRGQMIILLENLISNAIKFHRDEPPQIHISAKSEDGEWTFAVKDNGIGIDPRYQDRLFKMFSRLHTREEYEGAGMGLAISKKIVERHGGRMWFESEPGKGSTFYFAISIHNSG